MLNFRLQYIYQNFPLIGGVLIKIEKRVIPYTPVIIAFLLLFSFFISFGLFVNSLETNESLQNILFEIVENDPKAQREMSSGEIATFSNEVTNDVLNFTKGVLKYPIYLLGVSTLLSLVALFTMRINKFMSAIILSMAGVLSIFTLLPPVLLFFASNRLFKTASNN